MPAAQKGEGVTATLKRVQKEGDTWAVEVEVTYPPTDEPWNVREMHVRHPDGHVFRISRRTEPAKSTPRARPGVRICVTSTGTSDTPSEIARA